MTINNNRTVPVSLDALAVGRSSTNAFLTVFETRSPNSGDVNYLVQTRWYNTIAESEWILTGYSVIANVKTAIWQPISASSLIVTETLTGNTGGAVGVDGANNINVVGDGTSITIAGNPATHTLTASSVNGQIMTGVIPDAHTAPGTSPVIPNSSGNITITGGQVAAGTTTNVIQTNSLAANTYTVQIQRSQAVASSTIGDNGVSHFSSKQFTADANGFVQLFGGTGPAVQQVKNQVFTTSGTYTPTSGMAYCSIQILGGGGGGGGGASTTSMQHSSGAGGGGGEYASGIFSAATIGVSQTVTIGTGGAGNSGAAGSNGGNSSVGTLITAFGGSGGPIVAATTSAVFAQGGAGGTGGSGGDFRTPGQNGFWSISNFEGGDNIAGPGANTQFGSGGLVGNAVNGLNAGGYGAGGGGVSNPQSSSAITGGNGAAGIVIVTEYIA